MRTLLYFRTHFDDPANSGVIRKCRAVAGAFGADADYWYFDSGGLRHSGTARELSFSAPKYSLRHLLLYYFRADAHVFRHTDFRQYDIFFIRHLPAHPLFVRLLRRVKAQNPGLKILMELPTWPYDGEVKGPVSRLMALPDRWCRRALSRHTDYFVHYGPEEVIGGRPTLRISNGIQVSDIPPAAPLPDSPVLRMVAAGSWSPGHGLDRVLRAIPGYLAQGHRLQLTICGEGPGTPDIRALIHELNIGHCVAMRGVLRGREFDAVMDSADVAIGGLAIHRKHLKEASPLRHRDYCARGIPFIFAGKDSDIPDQWPFSLSCPTDDDPIDLQQVAAFIQRLKAGQPDYRRRMRQFAIERLDWSVKISELLRQLASYTH